MSEHSYCPSCGGIIGVDCYNPFECAAITQDMERRLYESEAVESLKAENTVLRKLIHEFSESGPCYCEEKHYFGESGEPCLICRAKAMEEEI